MVDFASEAQAERLINSVQKAFSWVLGGAAGGLAFKLATSELPFVFLFIQVTILMGLLIVLDFSMKSIFEGYLAD